MKNIIKIIRKLLGLELPYLLEEEEAKEPIIYIDQNNNVIPIPKNVEVKIYKNTELENQIMLLSNCAINCGITMNEARKLVANLGGININES